MKVHELKVKMQRMLRCTDGLKNNYNYHITGLFHEILRKNSLMIDRFEEPPDQVSLSKCTMWSKRCLLFSNNFPEFYSRNKDDGDISLNFHFIDADFHFGIITWKGHMKYKLHSKQRRCIPQLGQWTACVVLIRQLALVPVAIFNSQFEARAFDS